MVFNTTKGSSEGAPALSRGLSILELLAESTRGLTLSEISRRLSLAKSSTCLLLRCLESRGYVHCSERSGRYLFSLKLLRLSHMALHALKLQEGTSSLLRALVEQTQLTVHLGVLESDEAILVAKSESQAATRVATWPGRRMELHCTAIGKVLMAHLPEDRLDQLIARHGLPRHNENTIGSPRKLKEHLRSVKSLGYAVDDEEDEVGFRCLSAPIFDDRGAVAAAISVVGTTDELTAERVPFLVRSVRATAASISELLRSDPAE
jgi:DNA-binding IclR family transcriptional regulator